MHVKYTTFTNTHRMRLTKVRDNSSTEGVFNDLLAVAAQSFAAL